MLCRKRGLAIPETAFGSLESRIPPLLTPGAAEAFAVKIYRQVGTGTATLEDVLAESLTEYQSPIAPEVMAFQSRLRQAKPRHWNLCRLLFGESRRDSRVSGAVGPA